MKKTLRHFRNLLLLLSLSFPGASQERYAFSNLSLESGLSQITVLCIHQDRQGFMWFGTRNGLNRYDGYEFDIFVTDPDNPSSISDNHILAIEEEPGGALWIGTNHGLNRFDPEREVFTRYFTDPDNPSSLTHDIIQTLHIDRSGILWVGTNSGLNRYDPQTDSFTQFDFGGLLDDNPLYSLCSHEDKLYLGTTTSGLIIYDMQVGSYEILSHDPNDPRSLSHDYIRSILIDRDDNLWIGTHHNGVCFRRKGESGFRTLNRASGLTNDYIRTIVQTPAGEIVVGTFNGLNIIDPSTLRIEKYQTYSSSPGDLSHYSIFCAYIDRAQTLWIGSYAGGVDYCNRYGQKFQFYDFRRHQPGIFGLLGPVAETDEHLYIASEGSGIIEFDKPDGNFRHYPLTTGDDASHARNIVKTLYLDNGRLICGTNQGVVYDFDLRSRRYRPIYDTRTGDPIYYLGRSGKGELIIGGVNDPVGLVMVDRNGRISDRFPVSDRSGGVQFPNVRCVLEIEDDRFLIGTRNDGLFDYDRKHSTLIQYRYSVENQTASSIPENYISAIFRDSGGTIWIGTFGGGFSRFDPSARTFATYSTRNGLMNNNVCTIVEDRAGHLWISTISGIADFDPETKRFINYTHTNGVRIDEFTPHAGKLLSNGRIVFCGNNGMVMFDPGFMYDNPFVPPVVLRSLQLGNEPVFPDDRTGILSHSLNNQQEIVLAYNQSNFSIGFSALNFIFPERNQYAYMLEGFDAGWNEAGSRRIAYYTNIPPGKYRFIVRGSNNDGIWNEDGKSIDITILSPFWRTWWAYVCYLLALTGIVWMIVRYFTIRRRLENDIRLRQAEARVQAEFHESRDKLFTHFSHELRTPLTLIMSPLDDLIGSKGSVSSDKLHDSLLLMQGNARRLLRLVNNLMDFQKKEHGRLRLQVSEGNFVAFAGEMTDTFSEIARAREIRLAMESEVDAIPYWFDRSLMEKVFFNYLSNAFKNTSNGGSISVIINLFSFADLQRTIPEKAGRFPWTDIPYIFFEIRDSGEGIPEDELEKIFQPFYQVAQNEHSSSGTGLGLSLSRSIVEMHHGVIWAESPAGSGAVFRTILPVDASIYTPEERLDSEGIFQDEPNKIDSEAHTQSMAGKEQDEILPSKKKYTVLVVEDHIDIRQYIVSSLREQYHLLEAVNGAEAVEKALKHLPDLIVTDRMMPRMDGMKVVEILKEDHRTSHIPIIVVTAKALAGDMREGYRVGADDYITKPFHVSVLVERVANLIASREKLKMLYGKRFSLESMGVEAASVDERFMNKLYALLEKNISDPGFGLDDICRELGMSRANLYRKIKAITNEAPNSFIRHFRLEMGAKMLGEAQLSVSDVFVAVGFSNHAYFSNCFRTLYGISPTEYAARKKEKAESAEE